MILFYEIYILMISYLVWNGKSRYHLAHENKMTYILIDIIFGCTNESLGQEFSRCMHSEFQISMMGKLKFFLESSRAFNSLSWSYEVPFSLVVHTMPFLLHFSSTLEVAKYACSITESLELEMLQYVEWKNHKDPLIHYSQARALFHYSKALSWFSNWFPFLLLYSQLFDTQLSTIEVFPSVITFF